MIRKISFILSLVVLFSLVGCKNEKELSSEVSSISVESIISSKETIFEDTKSNTDTSSDTVTTENSTSSEIVEITTLEPQKSDEDISKKENSSAITEQKADSSVPSTSDIKPESTVSSITETPNANANDSKEIAKLIAIVINEYRNKQNTNSATVLPGLAEYAEYRSRQLISNFSHDTDDERAAATALKYGRYIDPSIYGMTGEPYFVACSGEAIVKAGYAGSKEYIAESIATLVVNSIAHWSYVGDPNNKYLAVGVTYESGLWYCDIAVSDVNYDEIS